MHIFEESLFFKLHTTIQQKTVKPTYLVSVRCQEAGSKKRSFNLLYVLDLFSERWQSTLFQIFPHKLALSY